MKAISLLKLPSLAAAAVAFFMAGNPASAVTINGTLSLSGLANFDSTSIDFTAASTLIGGTGNFTSLGSTASSITFTHMGSSVLYTSLTSVTDLGCGTGCVFTVTGNGNTATFLLSSITVDDTTNLTITGSGFATLTGFTNTPGFFSLTSQGTSGTNVSFSTTVNATPLPAALPLFAGGLGVIGLVARRKKRNRVAA